jgi:lipopolysaccharide biosynthesis regulator YciM
VWSFLVALAALAVAVGESLFRHRYFFWAKKRFMATDDEALHLFLSRFHLSKKTAELYWMIGSLFRLKGNVDHALRIHGAILEKGIDISRAKLEMAEDFFAAGLYGQAEALLLQVQKDPFRIRANDLLRLLYAREKEWHKAIAITELLSAETKVPRHHEIAHFYCELSWLALIDDRYDKALAWADKALVPARHNARANIIAGHIFLLQKNWLAAIARFRAFATQNPCYLSLVIEYLMRAYEALGRKEELLLILWHYWEHYRLVEALLAWSSVQENKIMPLIDEVKKSPDLKLLLKMLERRTFIEDPLLNLLRDFLRDLDERAAHVCKQCGYKTTTFLWQCPGCEAWASITPQRALYD